MTLRKSPTKSEDSEFDTNPVDSLPDPPVVLAKPKRVRKRPKKTTSAQPITATQTVGERQVPAPTRVAAPVTARIINEHAYWLGKAVKEDNSEAIAKEFDALKILCKMYYCFASPPKAKLSKVLQTPETKAAGFPAEEFD